MHGTAFLVWLLDSLVDHYRFKEEAPFVESLWPDESQELWVRLLVVCLFIALSWYARMLLKNEIRAKDALAAHRSRLEGIIAVRTKELEDNYRTLKKEMAERLQAQLEMQATSLVKRADQALYRAKQERRNRAMLESPEPPPQPANAPR